MGAKIHTSKIAANKGKSPITIIVGETKSPAETIIAPDINLAVLPFVDDKYLNIFFI